MYSGKGVLSIDRWYFWWDRFNTFASSAKHPDLSKTGPWSKECKQLARNTVDMMDVLERSFSFWAIVLFAWRYWGRMIRVRWCMKGIRTGILWWYFSCYPWEKGRIHAEHSLDNCVFILELSTFLALRLKCLLISVWYAEHKSRGLIVYVVLWQKVENDLYIMTINFFLYLPARITQ